MYNNNIYDQPPPSYADYNNNNQIINNSTLHQNGQTSFGNALYVVNPPNMYTNMVAQRQYFLQHRRLHQQKMLEQNYPVKYVIVHSALIGILSIVIIALQIVMIVKQVGYYWYGSGLWTGISLLIGVGIALAISNSNFLLSYTV